MDLTAQTKTSSQRYPLTSYWENTFHDITGEEVLGNYFMGCIPMFLFLNLNIPMPLSLVLDWLLQIATFDAKAHPISPSYVFKFKFGES